MSTGGAGRSQSAAFFNVSKRQEESSEQPNSKGKRKDTNPTVLVDQISPSTLVDSSETTQIASLLSLDVTSTKTLTRKSSFKT